MESGAPTPPGKDSPDPSSGKRSSGSALLPSLRLQSLDELLVGAVLKAGPTGTSVQGSKEALSLQTTSVNFRRFVQKSGPIFVAQDAVESVVRWENPAKTSFFAAAWAILCYWPALVVFIPNVALVSVLLMTYQAKMRTNGPPPESQDGPTPLAKDPPSEGSVDYFANLQNIQIMMGRVADLSDVLRACVPYLTWRDERLTRSLLLLSCLSSVLLALTARFIPYRLLFFLLGESALLVGHPLVRTFLADARPRIWTPKRRQRVLANWTRLLEDDELRDEELDAEVVEVQRIEVESRIGPGGGSGAGDGGGGGGTGGGGGGGDEVDDSRHSAGSTAVPHTPSLLDGSPHPSLFLHVPPSSPASDWHTEAVVGGDLPLHFRWLGTHWEEGAPAADGTVAADGWTYIFLDGSRAATPSRVVPAMNPGEKDKVMWAQTRRRRLTRRAIRNPLL